MSKFDALHHHVGVCVVLCQRIEAVLAIALRQEGLVETTGITEFVDAFWKDHTRPLEGIRKKIHKDSALYDVLPDLGRVVFRRNEIVHRIILDPAAMRFVETGSGIDVDADIALFSGFLEKCEQIVERRFGLVAVRDDVATDAVLFALKAKIDIEKQAQQAATANDAQRT